MSSTKSTLESWFHFKLRLIFWGIAVGLVAGLTVVAYRFALEHALSFSQNMYRYQRENHWFIMIWTGILVAGGLLTGWLVEKEPMIAGSGIPQVKGLLQSKLSMNWWRTIIGKCIGGTLSIGAGLSLGREGPSIQIGAAAGQGISKLTGKLKVEEHFLITCGASAGLAAAFNAPIAGVIFALEELHGNFSPLVMISTLASSVVADFISKEFFGLTPVFDFTEIPMLPLGHYGQLLLLGAVVGLMGLIFNTMIFRSQDLNRKLRLPVRWKPVIPFLLAGICGLLLPQVLGGGNELVDSLLTEGYGLGFIVLLLAVKLVFTMVCYGSSAPGGIFLPMLVIGALVGAAYSSLAGSWTGLDPSYLGSLIILAMAGYFTAIVKAPITGIILITEMTGSFSNLLPTGMVCLTAYVVAELFRSKPIYEALLDRLLSKGARLSLEGNPHKHILEIAVHHGSALDGKRIKDVSWPADCLIVSIRRGEKEELPVGDTLLHAGDYLIILTNEEAVAPIRDRMEHEAWEFHGLHSGM